MNTENNLKVGIYIPTLNKPYFVIRQIKYYASLDSPHPVYIGDDSSEENAKILQEGIKRYKDKLEINYFRKQEKRSQAECELELVSNIKEKYAAFSGDDDFLVPDSLTKCTEFLENKPDYSLATGLAVSFNLDRSGPYGEIKSMSDYARPEVHEETASDRLKNYLNRYHVTLFSVTKTEDLKKDWELSLKAKERSFQTEFMQGCLAVVRGKAKTLDCLAIIRQMHDARQDAPDIFDWIARPEWAETYKYFSEVLAKEISRIDSISEDSAKKILKESTWIYLQNHLVSAKQTDKKKKGRNFAKKFLKTLFPRSKEIFYKFVYPKLKEKNLKSLHYQVRQPWSPYYKDFKIIEKLLKAKMDND